MVEREPEQGERSGRAVVGRAVDPECRRLVEQLRRRSPDAFPTGLGPGEVGPDITLDDAQAADLYRVAFADAAGGGAVVWVDGEDELLVRAEQLRTVLRDGFVLVGIPVYTQQTKDAEVVVAFAVGRPGAPLGMVAATEPVPRGPAAVVERWGEQLVATSWRALVDVAAGLASASGVDDAHDSLLPAALVVSAKEFTVTAQAPHTFDRGRR
ncbi:hypothetical protein [Streptomyces sp. NPDC002088]|uniref:hypothetical protein n=1 Tax=Streptomyces sp. NPDC002088 TaxID=3154665 RepID=UPI00332C5B34